MKRRELIVALGGMAAWPLAVRAQQSKVATIGFLGANAPSTQGQWTAAFVQRLRELGWIEGRNLAIRYRWAEGHFDRSPQIMTEFVRLKVDVIVTHGTANVIAAKQTTSVIPIVFAAVADPVGNNLVANLARPGGNVTGLSAEIPDLVGKRLELLREIIPGLRRLAIMANRDNPAATQDLRQVLVMAKPLALEVIMRDTRRAEEIAPAIEAFKGSADALYVVTDPLFTTNRVRINTLALSARLPTMHGTREHVDAGGLMSYGSDQTDLFRRAGDYVDKILRGMKPADIPVEQPTKFDLVINLWTAKALGLTVPPSLLSRADEVIE